MIIIIHNINQIVKLADTSHDIIVTAKNIDFEFYWEEKCKDPRDDSKIKYKRHEHGGSYK